MIRWLPLLALIACGKGESGDSGTPAGTSPGTSSGTAGGTPSGVTTGTVTGATTGTPTTSGWRPTRYAVSYGRFAVQSGQATAATDVDLFGTPIDTPMQLAVRLADDTIDTVGLTPDNHCDVVFTSYEVVDPATWEGDTDAWFAFEMPATALVSEEDCLTISLAADWASPRDRVAAHRWGMTLEASQQADVDALLGGGTTGTYTLDRILGSSWWTSAVSGPVGGGTEVDVGVAFADEIDANGQIVRDAYHDTAVIEAIAVPDVGTGVVDAFYRVTPLGAWRDAAEL